MAVDDDEALAIATRVLDEPDAAAIGVRSIALIRSSATMIWAGTPIRALVAM